MRTVQTIAACREAVRTARSRGQTIRFVPTMGALHEGHVSLVRQAVADGGFVVVSIFVNPTQFNSASDLAAYPQTLDTDLRLCRDAGCDLLLAPSAEQMYPDGSTLGYAGQTQVRVPALGHGLCGRFRPGHFDGVAGVVAKLLNITQADVLYMGAKDFQQAAIVGRMLLDLNFAVELVLCETVREPDGLAMSSRNARLSPAGRSIAPALYAGLCAAAEQLRSRGDAASAVRAGCSRIEAVPGIELEYFEICDPATLEPLSPQLQPAPGARALIAVAAVVEQVRLIDNVVVQIPRNG